MKPRYLKALESGAFKKQVQSALHILENCCLCAWNCHVDRTAGEIGECQTGMKARVYSYMPHVGEERPISGKYGSGTIFFSGCNMHCVYCQNADISQENYGMEVTNEKLASIMLELQNRHCHNINLVSPSHIVPQIMHAIYIAAKEGLHIPIVYNTGGYDLIPTLKLLEGIIDIYMPDMKYSSAELACKYSGVNQYPKINRLAVNEMQRQVGDLQFDNDGIAQSGLLIRHLVLPNNLAGTEEIMQLIQKSISKHAYVNLMDQYSPQHKARKFPELFRRLTVQEFHQAVGQAIDAGIIRIDHLS